VVPWGIRTGVVVVVEEDCLADHVEAVKMVVELKQYRKVAGRGLEMVWTDASADCLSSRQDKRL
jgi:hypothetical protein